MQTKSALAALGLQPDPLRRVWNGMSTQDRKFIARLAQLKPDMHINEHQQMIVAPDQKSWDELNHAQQVSVRESLRRMSAWAAAAGVNEALQAAA